MSNMTFAQRQIVGEYRYLIFACFYQTLDFTEWGRPEDEPFYLSVLDAMPFSPRHLETNKGHASWDSENGRYNAEGEFRHIYEDVLPPYCTGFKSFLGYKLDTCRPIEVGQLLDTRFPKVDEIDCDYLTDILSEIQLDIKRGFGYDPGQPKGIDRVLPAGHAIDVNLQGAKRWLEKAYARAKEARDKSLSDLLANRLAKQNRIYDARGKLYKARADQEKRQSATDFKRSHSNTNPVKPATILERNKQAEMAYQAIRGQFKTNDYLRWELFEEAPTGEEVQRNYDELIPPYSLRYPTMLGFVFSCIEPITVPHVLDAHFSKPDRLDCDYINDVLIEIEKIVSANYSFSPKSSDGIDYYNGCENESQMMEATYAGVNTDNKFTELVTKNIERARKWLVRNEESLSTLKHNHDTPAADVSTSVNRVNSSAQATPTATREMPVIEWAGKVADLAELFYRLARAGFIDLAAHRSPEGNLLGVCRHICQVFQVAPAHREGAAKNLYAYLSKFTPEQLTKGEIDEATLSRSTGRKPSNVSTVRMTDTLSGFSPTTDTE